jgi:hypothetical protein
MYLCRSVCVRAEVCVRQEYTDVGLVGSLLRQNSYLRYVMEYGETVRATTQ